MRKIAKRLFVIIFFIISFNFLYSETADRVALSQGCDAFKAGDYNSAMILLRKALSYKSNDNAENRYMLIAAEMYSSAYNDAVVDCDYYLRFFPNSMYTSHVLYQKGRATFYLGEYEKAILVLSDFCHQFNDHEMYASALFWIAESFFAGYNYDEALPLYERIVNEFSNDAKARTAQFRIETIAQQTREEKLLYLLQKTGEAYLATKEDYEKQLSLYNALTTSTSGKEKYTGDLQQRNEDLENENVLLQKRIDELQAALSDLQNNKQTVENSKNINEDILRLKEKAREAQILLDEGAK